MHKRYILCGNNSTVFDARYRNDRIRTVQTNAADHREFSISPVKTLVEVVHRQACGDSRRRVTEVAKRTGPPGNFNISLTRGPLDVLMDQSLSESAIHRSRLYLRMVPPVCPVHSTKRKRIAP